MMAKDRNKRYASVRDLIIDLECLLAGEPPKLARQHIEARLLAELGKGEADEDDGPRRMRHRSYDTRLQIWIWIMGILLGISVLVNLVLAMKR